MSKTLYMETTEISAEKTAGEIIAVLVAAAGVTQVNTEYEAGRIKGLRWIMRVDGRDVLFAMPARVDPVYKILCKRRDRTFGDQYFGDAVKVSMREKAARVAWRQLLRWVQAQMAMIECGMTEASEVFLAYVQYPSGQTLFEVFRESGMKALPAPEVQR